MTKKRKRYPDLNQKLERPWCYYCERDFDDLKILISHQKAKHFKCDRCGRRLNTAGGLSVHMTQVHKENLTHVENANPGRQGLEIEIFGMEGVPAEIIDQHNQQVTQAHFAEEQERARLTGNPVRGLYSNGQAPPTKNPKVVETLDEIEERANKFRQDRKNGVPLPVPAEAVPVPIQEEVLPPFAGPPMAVPAGFPGQPPLYPPQGIPPPFPPANGAIPARPGSIPGQLGALPPRPGFGAPPPGVYPPNATDPNAISASLDDLIGEVTKEGAAEKKEEKKNKKDKNMKLIFFDEHTSPEEKMAALPRFAEFMQTREKKRLNLPMLVFTLWTRISREDKGAQTPGRR
ncbi:hypothetical protein IAQ61_010593 [Plenodomus lingam]|uniref:uncharacterized protein n=1 Tax=Leptosphaeria maculans TaxID=5022 RepID=UPI00332B85DB|nr:hypothetical protein IAQ61_010593 [Plenodomus lingam]